MKTNILKDKIEKKPRFTNKSGVFFVLFFSFLGIFNVFGVNFSNLNLSGNLLLFNANFEAQDTLYLSRLTDLSMQQLTVFPEKLEVVNNGRTIIAANRFGAARLPVSGGLPVTISGFPSFANGNIPLKGRPLQMASSLDGRWFLYIEPTSAGFGTLFLVENSNGQKRVVSENIELPAQDFPALWSPDSRLFVYSKGGNLFYFPIIHDLSAMANERLRQLGSGTIRSVCWGSNGDFYYFTGNKLYQVINPELFTRTLYGDFLSIGNVVASLPFDFESAFDRFWVSPNSDAILINKRDKNLFLFMLADNQYNNSIMPHIQLLQGSGNLTVLWAQHSAINTPSLTVVSSLSNEIKVWRFDINEKTVRSTVPSGIPISSNGSLSPDGTKAVFWNENGLEIWDYINWRLLHRIRNERFYSCVWINNREIAAGGAKFTEVFSIDDSQINRRIICLSAANEFGFEEARGFRILAKTGNEWFVTDGRTSWTSISNPSLRPVSLASDQFRVFLENQNLQRTPGHFSNIPMIRNLSGAVTQSLLSNHSSLPAFTLGQRIEVALCFDLYDDETGLSKVLQALDRTGFKATFFLNGDFIRRNPAAARAIVQQGHEAASLFFAPMDLSDARYSITQQFIAQGLARNEDEFNKATGKELALLWHPPFFRSSASIISFAQTAGYRSVVRDIDPQDWVSRNDALRNNIRILSAPQIIDLIISQKKDGAVIPVRLGINPGGRDDYLFTYIDVLLDALLRSGAVVVPASEIIK